MKLKMLLLRKYFPLLSIRKISTNRSTFLIPGSAVLSFSTQNCVFLNAPVVMTDVSHYCGHINQGEKTHTTPTSGMQEQ